MISISISYSFATITLLIASTQLLLTLYGAGLRRPFGSLRTVTFMPDWLRRSDGYVLSADLIFVTLVATMWVVIFRHTNALHAIIAGIFFYCAGDYLAYRIDLKRSFLISLGLGCLCVGTAVLAATLGGN
jgi:hypothetical protein